MDLSMVGVTGQGMDMSRPSTGTCRQSIGRQGGSTGVAGRMLAAEDVCVARQGVGMMEPLSPWGSD